MYVCVIASARQVHTEVHLQTSAWRKYGIYPYRQFPILNPVRVVVYAGYHLNICQHNSCSIVFYMVPKYTWMTDFWCWYSASKFQETGTSGGQARPAGKPDRERLYNVTGPLMPLRHSVGRVTTFQALQKVTGHLTDKPTHTCRPFMPINCPTATLSWLCKCSIDNVDNLWLPYHMSLPCVGSYTSVTAYNLSLSWFVREMSSNPAKFPDCGTSTKVALTMSSTRYCHFYPYAEHFYVNVHNDMISINPLKTGRSAIKPTT